MEPPPKRQRTASGTRSKPSRPQRTEKSLTEEPRSEAPSPRSDLPIPTRKRSRSVSERGSNPFEESREPDYDNLLLPEFLERPRIQIDPVSFTMSRQPSSARGRASQSTDANASASASSSRHSTDPDRQSQYQLVTPASSSNPRQMTQNNKDQLIQSLRTHKVNTITELRRIEKIFAYLDSAEVTEPMTAAWRHYVNSNNLLNELRGLTGTYPFSSECLNEAKTLVVADPQSVRSWNYCWLVLKKVEREGLIAKHARLLASQPDMWGGRKPTPEGIDRLTKACVASWERALAQMLRHWDEPPSLTGS